MIYIVCYNMVFTTIIECGKCCTDKVVQYVNCICVPTSIAVITAKAYEVPIINDMDWGYIVTPALVLTGANILYYSCCRLLLRKKKRSIDGNVEMNIV